MEKKSGTMLHSVMLWGVVPLSCVRRLKDVYPSSSSCVGVRLLERSDSLVVVWLLSNLGN